MLKCFSAHAEYMACVQTHVSGFVLRTTAKPWSAFSFLFNIATLSLILNQSMNKRKLQLSPFQVLMSASLFVDLCFKRNSFMSIKLYISIVFVKMHGQNA